MGSRRLRRIGVLLFVAITLFFVAAPWYRTFTRQRLLSGVERVGTAARDHVLGTETRAALDAKIAAHKVRVRILAPQGAQDLGPRTLADGFSHLALRWARPELRDALTHYDRALPALHERPEVQALGRGERASGCRREMYTLVLVCHDVWRGAGGHIVHTQVAAIQTYTGVFHERLPLFVLMLQAIFVAIGLGWWVFHREVKPMEALGDAVRERVGSDLSTDPVAVDGGGGEIAALGSAVNALLEAVEAGRRANMERLADVAHELKGPLATLGGFVELALDEERLAPLGEPALGSVARVNACVGEILELARAEAASAEEDWEVARLDALVEALLARFRADPRWEGVTFAAELGVWEVRMQPGTLERALENLVENAAHHAEGLVRVRLTPGRLEVWDDGAPVASERQERVFDRYFTGREGGTGLGLAIARAVARGQGAGLTLEDGKAFVMAWPES